jgi:hypothetical protein
VIKPSSGDYYATTHVYRRGALEWTWSATLHQPPPWEPYDLAHDSGWCFTEKRAKRKADRAARRMMRAADSWTTRIYKAKEAHRG